MREMYCQARSSTGTVLLGVFVIIIIIVSSFLPLFDALSLRAVPGTGHSKSLSGAEMPARQMFGRAPCARVSTMK